MIEQPESFAARPVIIETNMATILAVLGMLQVALNYPGDLGAARPIVQDFYKSIVESLDPEHGELYQTFMAGM